MYKNNEGMRVIQCCLRQRCLFLLSDNYGYVKSGAGSTIFKKCQETVAYGNIFIK